MKNTKVINLTVTAMMAAILCVLAPFSIPIADVPISAATFVVYLSALLLGTKRSLVCVGLYLLIGIVGVPVFAKWGSGFGIVAGPTGGYLIGYLFIALFTGWFTKLGRGKVPMMFLGMLIGTIVCYTLGTTWLAIQASLSAKAALAGGVLPFIPGDLAKMVLSIMVALPMRRQLAMYFKTK